MIATVRDIENDQWNSKGELLLHMSLLGSFRRALLPFVACVFTCLATTTQANTPVNHHIWDFLSGTGNAIYLVAGVAVPLIEDGRAGKNNALRTADALGTSVLLSEGLKYLVQEKRPDSTAHDSFPSGHATAAFSVATVESGLHPKQAIYWYAGATLISASRVALHRHTVGDVLAGTVLGYGVARLELSSRRGLLLAPFIVPEKHALGLTVHGSF